MLVNAGFWSSLTCHKRSPMMKDMKSVTSLAEAENFIFSTLGSSIRLATPLGLGKPNQLLNSIYERVARTPEVSLKIFTALSLDFAKPQSDMEERFLGPFYKRHFGEDYPHLRYLADLHSNKVPKNIQIHEFYFQAGTLLKCELAQQAYISLNYTHVAKAIVDHDINVIIQMVALSPDGRKISLSCNPDLTLDVVDLYKKSQKPLLIVGVVHPDLPYLGGDAEVDSDFFDLLVHSREVTHKLFAVPRVSVDEAEHMIGFYASQLVVDSGTLQIGIGSLSDALVNSMILRQKNNSLYQRIFTEIWKGCPLAPEGVLQSGVLKEGLYGTSEMLMDGFMHLRKAGVLKREIFDHEESAKRYLHGAFYLGSSGFYEWLRSLSKEDYEGLSMTRVSKVNDLYDPHELALRKQRKNARFFNTCMSVTLLGAAASDTTETGLVVSGVGGQYNFVAMAQELEEARSILMLRSTRLKNKKMLSNIVDVHGNATIPRHLRDVVITEYGIAFLRGASDEQVIQRLIEIADSEFQEELVDIAQKHGKLSRSYKIPNYAKHNSLKKVKEFIGSYKNEKAFALFPFGSDFTEDEIRVGRALTKLKDQNAGALVRFLLKGFSVSPQKYQAELKRMNLHHVRSVKEHLYRKLLLGALKE
ncbi:acetyl-CoA hydrolase/transferase C-terminal domain-containing protein [Bdellovibrio sp. HCB-110]|uniref:acetyl-CoA hydrolase/transferase C-terminal domain-containing protein n=1 Tax=Bdellovibrio sp. HCB-110 TaxID=3391182 RepID=UPI0039B4180C